MIPHEEVVASLALNDLNGLGPVRFRELISRFGSASEAIRAAREWRELPGLGECAGIGTAVRAAVGRAQADAEMAGREGARIYLAHAGPYPALLRSLSVPPPVLYVSGGDICGDRRAVALVGSRRSTHYGDKVAREMSAGFSAAGVVTVSGLARGIDTSVHRATLLSGGHTWAVVGSGLLMTYPPENRTLAREIIDGGGSVISEFPMALKPHPSNFPRRNRIIAGISAATIVIEGGETSGSLITARIAANEGRDVFAVPGPATSALSRAPHLLLRQGACLAESASDVLAELGWPVIGGETGRTADDAQGDPIVNALSDDPTTREELISRTGLDASAAAARLVELELMGLIKTLPGGKLVRT